jgi:hypothetical protein
MRRSVCVILISIALAAGASAQQEPKYSQDWFRQAGERMNLRESGAQPFHLWVQFHANAGEEMLAPGEKSQFLIGDGTYDEVWLDPQTWRREVKLGDYHAVEVEANGVRKMQASSDHVPSRVLMLIRHLMEPVPDYLWKKGSNRGLDWQIDHVTAGNTPLVRLSKVSIANSQIKLKDFWYFQHSGELVMSDSDGLTAVWSAVTTFAGKTVPLKLALKASKRELLTAMIAIEPAGQEDKAVWDLPGGAAEPGITLYIFNAADVPRSDSETTRSFFVNTESKQPASALSVTGVIDRTGAYREVEVLLATDPSLAREVLTRMRASRTKPATLNKSPCEISPTWMNLWEH